MELQNLQIRVHSFESLAAVDGPGLRCAVFLQGCPLRCAYCHNPDTWGEGEPQIFTVSELALRLKRYKPYFGKNGGVTFSGGEPLLQAKALTSLTKVLQSGNIHVAIDTAGSVLNEDVALLLKQKPMILLDVKMVDEERFAKYISPQSANCTLAKSLEFLKLANENGCEIWLRYVVLNGINDYKADIEYLLSLKNQYKNIKNISLLPYHTLGVQKYKALGLDYTLGDLHPPSEEKMKKLREVLEQNGK